MDPLSPDPTRIQIRLHLSHCGYPIANDPVYCDRRPTDGFLKVGCGTPPSTGSASLSGSDDEEIEVMWLHAWRYSFDDPLLGFEAEAPVPKWGQMFLPIEISADEAYEGEAEANHALDAAIDDGDKRGAGR
jgi:hypothetical protein